MARLLAGREYATGAVCGLVGQYGRKTEISSTKSTVSVIGAIQNVGACVPYSKHKRPNQSLKSVKADAAMSVSCSMTAMDRLGCQPMTPLSKASSKRNCKRALTVAPHTQLKSLRVRGISINGLWPHWVPSFSLSCCCRCRQSFSSWVRIRQMCQPACAKALSRC